MSDNCLFCDETENLEQHHVVPRMYGGTDQPENLITVCSDCHKKIERAWSYRFYHALGARKDLSPDMMNECIEDLRMILVQARSAVGGQYERYKKEVDYARGYTKDDEDISPKQVLAIKRDAFREFIEGESIGGMSFPMEEIRELEDYSQRLLDYLEEAD